MSFDLPSESETRFSVNANPDSLIEYALILVCIPRRTQNKPHMCIVFCVIPFSVLTLLDGKASYPHWLSDQHQLSSETSGRQNRGEPRNQGSGGKWSMINGFHTSPATQNWLAYTVGRVKGHATIWREKYVHRNINFQPNNYYYHNQQNVDLCIILHK